MRWLIVLLLAGCSTGYMSDGYQFGDVTREALRLQLKYCHTGDLVAKAVLNRIAGETDMPICEIDFIELLEGK